MEIGSLDIFSNEALNRLLGKEQKDRLKEHLRTENGRVPASKMMIEIGEIFNSVKEGKNS